MIDFQGVFITLIAYMGALATLIYLLLFIVLPAGKEKKKISIDHLQFEFQRDIEPVIYGNSGNWRYLRKKIFEIQGDRCLCCGIKSEKMHVDHIRPKSLYPHLEFMIDNLQVLCPDCNRAKSFKDQTDYRNSAHLLSMILEIHTNKLLRKKYVYDLDLLKKLASDRALAEIENKSYKKINPIS